MDAKTRGNEWNKTHEDELDSDYNNLSFSTEAEPNFSKIVTDIKDLLMLVLEKETRAIDRDVSIVNQEMDSVKQNFETLIQEINIDVSGNATSLEKQIEAVDLIRMAVHLADKLDAMTEMSEMTSLRLQMIMERRSRFISTLSNLMKKISATQDTLIQNLK
jgi:hypothetical protein